MNGWLTGLAAAAAIAAGLAIGVHATPSQTFEGVRIQRPSPTSSADDCPLRSDCRADVVATLWTAGLVPVPIAPPR